MSTAIPPAQRRLAGAGAVLALALSGALVAFATIAPGPETALPAIGAPVFEPVALSPQPAFDAANASFLREERFQRGDTLAAFVARLGLADDEGRRLAASGALRQLRPGLVVSAEVTGDGRLVRLSHLAAGDRVLRIEADGTAYRLSAHPAVFDTQVLVRSGLIRASLFGAADAAGLPDSVAVQLAEVFGSDIDFHRDLRRGDRFTVVYEMLHLDGRPVRSGRVLAAEFVNGGKTFRAVWFAGNDGKGGYYAPDGRNLRKAFLRTPIEFSRVSSGFGLRLHPVHGFWAKHRGVDYAAPVGTRVRSVGDGIIDFAGWRGGYGKVIIVRHAGNFATLYAHLAGFAPGMQRGARVGQGDTIGFVGMTGTTTGPHLHFEMHVGGEPRNPAAVALPAAEPVPQAEMTRFLRQAAPLVTRLDFLANAPVALLE